MHTIIDFFYFFFYPGVDKYVMGPSRANGSARNSRLFILGLAVIQSSIRCHSGQYYSTWESHIQKLGFLDSRRSGVEHIVVSKFLTQQRLKCNSKRALNIHVFMSSIKEYYQEIICIVHF